MSDAGSGRGRLLVVTGPGGVGKGTVVDALVAAHPELVVSLSATTRPPRREETDGVHYHFLDDEEFDRWVAADEFMEWVHFAGHRYGTPWSSVRDALSRGAAVVLEIEVEGSLNVRRRFPDAVLVFLLPPDVEELEARLRQRGVDSPQRIAERMRISEGQIAKSEQFDHVIVNRDVDETVVQLGRILASSPAL